MPGKEAKQRPGESQSGLMLLPKGRGLESPRPRWGMAIKISLSPANPAAGCKVQGGVGWVLGEEGSLCRGLGQTLLEAGLGSLAVASQALGAAGGSEPHLSLPAAAPPLRGSRAAAGREGGESLQSISLQEFQLPGAGMSFREAGEAGNQGRGAVIEAVCWKQRMHLEAGSGGHAEPHEPPGPSRRLNSDQPQLLRGVTIPGLCLERLQAEEVSNLTLSNVPILWVM